jgi:hypothetical protein
MIIGIMIGNTAEPPSRSRTTVKRLALSTAKKAAAKRGDPVTIC